MGNVVAANGPHAGTGLSCGRSMSNGPRQVWNAEDNNSKVFKESLRDGLPSVLAQIEER